MRRGDRGLALATAATFVISSAFPVLTCAADSTAGFPTWYGPCDVAVAFLLGLLAVVVSVRGAPRVHAETVAATYHVYRVLIHGLLALLVVFFAAGARVTWSRCLTGFGWRAWLLLYALPMWLALRGRQTT